MQLNRIHHTVANKHHHHAMATTSFRSSLKPAPPQPNPRHQLHITNFTFSHTNVRPQRTGRSPVLTSCVEQLLMHVPKHDQGHLCPGFLRALQRPCQVHVPEITLARFKVLS